MGGDAKSCEVLDGGPGGGAYEVVDVFDAPVAEGMTTGVVMLDGGIETLGEFIRVLLASGSVLKDCDIPGGGPAGGAYAVGDFEHSLDVYIGMARTCTR
jgi:hypothetical protein